MKSHTDNSGPQHQETRGHSSRTEEVFDMEIPSQSERGKVSIWQILQVKATAKLVGGLALAAILTAALALPLGTGQASPLSDPPVQAAAVDIEVEGGTGSLFEPWELGHGTNPYMTDSGSVGGGVLAPLVSVEPLVDIEDEGGTGRMFEPWEYPNGAGENEQANIFPEVEL